MADRYNTDKESIILYLGDFDPSGLDIERSLDNRLQREGVCFEVKRVQLTHTEALSCQLPPNPSKISDTRYKTFVNIYGSDSWELDALEPEVLQNFVEEAIKSYIDIDKWNVSLKDEEEGKAELKNRFTKAMNTLKKEFK